MDIYFCDSCAARVSDADLHRGHGIKRGDVVICGHCIEQGLGKDLLAQAGAGATGVATPQAPIDSPVPAGVDYQEHDLVAESSAPLIDRDGVDAPRDQDEAAKDNETDAVRAMSDADESDDLVSAAGGFAALHDAPDDADESDIQELLDVAGYEVQDDDQPSTGIHPDPMRARHVTDPDDDRTHTSGTDDLAEAIASSDVVDNEPPQADDVDESGAAEPLAGDDDAHIEDFDNDSDVSSEDEDEDLEDEDLEDEDLEDEDLESDDEDVDADEFYDDDEWDDEEGSAEAGVETAAFAPDDYPDANEEKDADRGVDQPSQPGVIKKSRRRGKKRRRIAGGSAAKSTPGKKKGGDDKLRIKGKSGAASAVSASRSNGSSRRATTKGAKGASSRRAPAKKKNNAMLILLSIGSALLISIIVLLLVGPAISSRSGGEAAPSSDLERVSIKVKRAQDLTISAQRSDNIGELREALRAFEAARDAVVALEDNLPEGWTEDDYHNQVRRVWRFHDLQSQSVNLRNRIGVLQRRGE